ncbi:MAG TPA: glutaminyl-peptide cyclotransferase [Longimicrobiaceae bacterium]|nr:glutaminyl-peptide cyclotransferase [Longimicrobiaceae bacterium]
MPSFRRTAMGAMLAAAAASLAAAGACRREAAADGSPTAPVLAVETVKAYPHDSLAFTQGLVFHDGALYESTGRFEQSSLRRVELETGRVLQKVDVAPQHFAEGLALREGRLYQLTWQDGVGFIYDLESFAPQGTFPVVGEGWGFTTDGESFIMSDGSNQLRFLDPQSFQETRTLEVTDGDVYVHQLNELEWVHGEIWANVWHSDSIARIDPATGRVVAWLDLSALYPKPTRHDPEAVLNGIAYDAGSDRLFVTGKLWPALFEIRVPELVRTGAAARP